MENKNILIAIDSYKGTFSSAKINELVKKEILNCNPNNKVECINIADGGEGSVEALINAINGSIVNKKVKGPYLEEIDSYYGVGELDGKKIAIIEVASVVGFQHKKIDNDPGLVTTFGIGELIIDAIDKNISDIYVCLGGSISNDAGSGIACCLGYRFFDKNDNEFLPVGKTLKNIARVDKSNYLLDKIDRKINIYCLCDVTNPFYGPHGASFVFAKQKGAKEEELSLLDDNLRCYHEVIVKELNVDNNASMIPGTGAAGGICYSMHNLLNAKILSGIKTILKLNDFENKIKNSDIVITGEGKLDSQSFDGKVISEIREISKKYSKKLIGIFGCSEVKEDPLMDIYSLFDITENLSDISFLIENTENRIKSLIEKIK